MRKYFFIKLPRKPLDSLRVEFRNSKILIRSMRNFYKKRRMPMLSTGASKKKIRNCRWLSITWSDS